MHRSIFLRLGALFALVTGLVAVGLAIPAAPASATGSVTRLTRCDVPGVPQITAPGTYLLAADVTTAVPQTCLAIEAPNVTLILIGHTITGPSNGFGHSGVGIEVSGSGATILGPGTLSGWDRAIYVGTSGSVLAVKATGNNTGIYVNSTGGTDVLGNVTTDNTNYGILVPEGATGNTIIGNYAHGNPSFDLFDGNANCDSNVWLGNDFGTANQSCIH
jgi:parallel beta-helix repeat protein